MSTALALVRSLASVTAADGAASDDLVALGIAAGTDAFETGASMHHTLKGLDLLLAMTLYVVEKTVAEEPESTAAEGVRVSRRLQRAASLITLAVTKGYTQAMGDAMRNHFRHLRHDLRNPLGTIKSVLAMMDDETMPPEARANPRFRVMARRNAQALGNLIAERLSDGAALFPVFALQSVSLRTIACTVRRDLRAEADVRGCSVVVASVGLDVKVDAIALELLLHELLYVALQEAQAGEELFIEFREVRDEHVTVSLRCAPSRPPVREPNVLQRLAVLATRMGGELEVSDGDLRVWMPVYPSEVLSGGVVAPPPDVVSVVPVIEGADSPRLEGSPLVGPVSSDGEAGYDLRRASEREHGQSGPL